MENNIPRLKTERLQLRALQSSDADDLFEVRFHDEVIKFIAREKPTEKDTIKQFIVDRNEDFKNGKIVFWAIQKKENPSLIGTICLWNFNDTKTIAEVGYELHPEYHNKGFMSEALQVVLEFGFTSLKLYAIEAFTDKNNENSRLLLNKFNFIYDANRTDEGFPNNRIYIKTND